MKQSKAYPNIDMIQTGKQLKQYIEKAGMSVKDIQEQLHLSCPQPIYRWISGKILPSVDHLLVLSELFGVHMEELLVKKQKNISSETVINANLYFENRILVYYKRISCSKFIRLNKICP